MPPAIGQLDIVPGLRPAAVPHHEVGRQFPRQEVDGRPLPFVAEPQPLNDHCPLHFELPFVNCTHHAPP